MSKNTGRIAQRFAALAAEGKTALIPYVVAGDPYADMTVDLMHKMVAAGADVLELGVPFSDPMAEGPVIQKAHERALENGVSLRKVLAMVAAFRSDDQTTPVLLMGYANPLLRMGFSEFAQQAYAAGLDGLLTVDLPPEEVTELNTQLKLVGIDNIFLVAPTTPAARIQKIAEVATGFVYYVSLKGVTGAANLDIEEVSSRLTEIRKTCNLPLAVGFGIKDARSAAAVAKVAEGVVVGSAIVSLMAQQAEAGATADEVAAGVVTLLRSIRAGMDSV